MLKNIIMVKSDIKTKQVWTWVGDKLKWDCQDEEHGFIPIASYHCCTQTIFDICIENVSSLEG